ncbi:hypothetical protein [Vibrio coralliilyticus]|uniref:hypothetical protein n=1 Tax=Vibrio coralliilyticus TaxID=190893 RepID=UPI000BAADC22|nr:hypothetical protein [Vibrio coralliilyticus]NOI60893.1 hypothetical protein [Vibrio coralliilyticus]PAT65234.1 hypothetical protein CKA27_25670 [Vibrio coralliilyticus]
MSVFSISYDLNSPGQKYTQIHSVLESFPGYVHLMDSTWLVSTQLNSQQLLDKFKPMLDGNDKLFISKVNASEYSGWLSDKEWGWITNHT